MDDFFSLHTEELLTGCVLAVIHKYRMGTIIIMDMVPHVETIMTI